MTKSTTTPARTITITLPESIEILDSAGVAATVTPGDAWDADFLMAIVTHGITQKVNDGAASALALTCPAHVVGNRTGAAATAARREWVDQGDNAALVDAARREMRQAVADHLSAGEWGVVRQAGATIDPATKGRRATAYEWMFNAGTPDADAARLAYKAIDKDDAAARIEYRDEVWADHGPAIGEWKLAQLGI